LLHPSNRTTLYGEYYLDPSNGKVPNWKSVRTSTAKYIETYDGSGNITFKEYYNLVADPDENDNLLGDGDPSNDPPAWVITKMQKTLQQQAKCVGAACLI
ncbi:MAG: hypothetical protein ABI083_19680, partial [Lapillicoccus sp.]